MVVGDIFNAARAHGSTVAEDRVFISHPPHLLEEMADIDDGDIRGLEAIDNLEQSIDVFLRK